MSAGQASVDVRLAFSVNQSFRLGDFGLASLAELEVAAGIGPGYLADFAQDIERRITAVVRDVIDELPAHLRDLTAVQNFPFVIFAQRQRVRDVLALAMTGIW